MDKVDNYEDIINLPHHVSVTHQQMSISARAAQFAPFAALSGYDDAIEESSRQTNTKIELDDNAKEEIDEKLRLIFDKPLYNQEITITYFVLDEKKEGGSYDTIKGIIKKFNESTNELILTDEKQIKIDDILNISSSPLK